MKKSLLALAALTAFAGAASAQSSVTLFGIVDLSARNVKNGTAGSINSLSTNGQASSRLGFRGVEDLGGGMRAGFWLEGDISGDTGGTTQTWQRRSTVSLLGGFGEVRMGRDYTPTFTAFSTFDPFGYVGVASPANVRGVFLASGGAGTAVRANNTINYFLPAMGGLYGNVQVAAGEGATGNKYTGARVGYAAGPVNVAGAFGKTAKTGTMVDDLTTLVFGASFNMGFATIQGVYEKADYSTTDRKLYTISTIIPVGSGNLKAQYTKSSGSSAALDTTQFGLGYVYSLSKRTSLYTNYGSIDNGGNAATGGRATSSGSGPAFTRGGEKSTGYEFGIRHDF
jgi:predicted porin